MCRKLCLFMVVSLLLIMVGNAWAVDPAVTEETATASGEDPFSAYQVPLYGMSPEGRLAITAVDDSGMSGDLHGTAINTMWLTDDVNEVNNPGTVEGPAWLRIEFPHAFNVESMWIWNYNQASVGAARGMKDVTIEYSVTGGSDSSEWTTIAATQLTIAPNEPDYAHDDEIIFGDVDARYVVITADSATGNWGAINEDNDANYWWYGAKLYGLAEVRFFGTTQWATSPSPSDGYDSVERDDANSVQLSWLPGDQATGHDVYIGTDEAEVTEATRAALLNVMLFQPSDPNYLVTLESGTWYYWKIDEVSGGTPQWFGPTWSFRTLMEFGLAVPPSMITATASSERGDQLTASKVVDGSGLDETGLLHDNLWYNLWTSDPNGGGDANVNPGTEPGPAWLRFEFTKPFMLTGMWVWNSGEGPPWIDRGLRYVTVEYSTTGGSDSSEWTKLGKYEWPQASGYGWNTLNHLGDPNPWYDPDEYPGFEGPAFGEVDAQYVVITANDIDGNWGGTSDLPVIPDVNMLYSLSEVRFHGVTNWATWPNPADGQMDVELGESGEVLLSWVGGMDATAHDIYFGTSFDDVNEATRPSHPNLVSYIQEQADTECIVYADYDTEYYWRVDEVNAAGLPEWKGDVWKFTTTESVVLPPFPPPVTVTVACTTYGDPCNIINGVGLDVTGRLHSNNYQEMWACVPGSYAYPGCVTGASWIAFEFDGTRELDEMWVWNYNEEWNPWDQTTSGLKDVWVQYSTTGGANASEWTTLGGSTTQFNKAPFLPMGWNKYRENGALNPNWDPTKQVHETEVDFGAAEARYVVLTPDSSSGWWGNGYYLGLSEVRFFDCVPYATMPLPADNTVDQPLDVVLRWRAGQEAVTHRVYFGTDENNLPLVATLFTGTEQYDPYDPGSGSGLLDWDKTYYWRINEIDGLGSVTTGVRWHFTTYNGVIVDNMEGVELNWLANVNGDVALETDPNYATETQSLKLDYSNESGFYYSEISAPVSFLPIGPDWTAFDVKALSLKFFGGPGNDLAPLYLGLDSGSGIDIIYYDGDPNDLKLPQWTEWNVDLADFGVDLTSIDDVYIGLGNRFSPSSGGSGIVYIDQIKLYPPRCVYERWHPVADIAGQDCYVDSRDVKAMANGWLIPDHFADLNADTTVNFRDYAIVSYDWLQDPLLWP